MNNKETAEKLLEKHKGNSIDAIMECLTVLDQTRHQFERMKRDRLFYFEKYQQAVEDYSELKNRTKLTTSSIVPILFNGVFTSPSLITCNIMSSR